MTLVDTGPLVALFDPKDHLHQHCRDVLEGLRGPLVTTAPVLTEVFHLLTPASKGSESVRGFVDSGGRGVFHLNDESLRRTFAFIEQSRDRPMDLARLVPIIFSSQAS